ncbi:MAG TPA: type II toxin-antitoxin system RelE/ParE family toxin [Kiritimatiellia bacterium]|nr:type II toxin-antitoxin system RelE/ParE family toxin [Kiritimatiellia bacterium]
MSARKTYSVEFARIAEQDLIAIVETIAVDDPIAAGRVLEKMEACGESLENFPERGRVVPELEAIGLMTHRELIVSPWRIIYRIAARTVYVVAVFDGRRNLEDVLLDRAIRTADET